MTYKYYFLPCYARNFKYSRIDAQYLLSRSADVLNVEANDFNRETSSLSRLLLEITP